MCQAGKGATVHPTKIWNDYMGNMGLIYGLKDSEGVIDWGQLTAEKLADETKELVRGWISLGSSVHPMSGSCGEKVTYSLNAAGVLTISGTGPMENYLGQRADTMGDYQAFCAPWYCQRNGIKKIVISSGVTAIGDSAFLDCYNAASVVIPRSVRTIGTDAFCNCPCLTAVTIPSGVTAIGEGAFWGCMKLRSITLPTSLREIGSDAFRACESLTTVTLPKGLNAIGANAFSWSGLTKVSIPGNLETISGSAFAGCSQLTSVTIQNGVKHIETGAFASCNALKAITIPNSVQQIDDYALGFMNGEFLHPISGFRITAARGSEAYFYAKNNGFAFTSNGGFSASYQDVGVADENLTVRFEPNENSSAVGLILKNQSVYPYVIRHADDGTTWGRIMGLKDRTGNITWGKFTAAQLNDASKEPVRGWVVLDNVHQGGTSGNAVWMVKGDTLTIRGTGAMKNYSTNTASAMAPWYSLRGQITNVVIEEGITSIGNYAFYGLDAMTDVLIPETVTTVGDYAFAHCNSLTEVTLGSNESGSPAAIGSYAFAWCGDLSRIQLGSNVESIGRHAFSSCLNLTEVQLPEGVKKLDTQAFYDCEALTTINFPESLTTIGQNCFQHCLSLKLIDLPGIPERTEEETITLTGMAALQEELAAILGAKADLRWRVETIDGKPDGTIAAVTKLKNGSWVLKAKKAGKLRLVAYDNYSQAQGSKEVEFVETTVIRPDTTKYLIAGKTLQLAVYRIPGSVKLASTWEITSGEEYATVSASGKLTAKKVEKAGTVTVTATPTNGSDPAVLTLQILPKTTAITLSMENEALGATLSVDMFQQKTIQLSAAPTPADALSIMKWTSSSTAIAQVDQTGTVKLVKPGTVTITAAATDGSNVKKAVGLTVYYLDPAKTLTATVTGVPKLGLQPDQTAQISISGQNGMIDAQHLTFTSSNPAIATVDETGKITAGEKAGTVTITATLNGDPLKRKATAKVNVIAMQMEELSLTPDQSIGSWTKDEAGEWHLTLDKKNVTKNKVFTVTQVLAQNYKLESFVTNAVTWTSTDTGIASVALVSGVPTVTIKANANGECCITAQGKDLTKAQAHIWISVRDYSPRLETAALRLNSYRNTPVSLGLRESYGNTITNIELVNAPEGLVVDVANRTLSATGQIKAGTYKRTMNVTCGNGEVYSYLLTISIANSLPSVTVKQMAKFNLFYLDGTAPLTITAGDLNITKVELLNTPHFGIDGSEGAYTLYYSEAFLDSPVPKVDTSATLKIYLDGYYLPVTKNITIATYTSKPALSTMPASSAFNTLLDEELSSTFQIWNKTTSEYLEPDSMKFTAAFANVECTGETLTLSLTKNAYGKYAGGTAYIDVKMDNWLTSIRVSHGVSVSTKLPTLKLGASTLTLNKYFTEITASTTAVLTQKNIPLDEVEIVSTARAGTSAAVEAEKLYVHYEDGVIVAEVRNPDVAPKNGTYSFTCKGVLPNGSKTAAVTLKVVVSTALPKVSLSATTVSLNKYLAGDEEIPVKVTVPQGYTVEGFQVVGNYNWLRFDEDNSVIRVTLTEDAPTKGNQIFKLTPIVRDNSTDQIVTYPSALTLTVKVYESTKLGVSLAASGKLDTLKPESVLNYTITKLANFNGTIETMELIGQDKDKFQAELDNTGAKPVIHLTMVDGKSYATNVTYKVQFLLTSCGEEFLSPICSFKVSQSAVKVTANPTSMILFQAQDQALTGKVSISVGEIKSIAIGKSTTLALQNAMGDGFDYEFDGNTAMLTIEPENIGMLKAGTTYNLYLEITPAGLATNLKPATVKIPVKVLK